MYKVDLSQGHDYISQRDNQIRPMITCNTTSMIVGLLYSGWTQWPQGKYAQYEDDLTNFLLTDSRVDAMYQKLFPSEYQTYISCNKDPKKSYPPNELHPILSYGTNLWLGGQPNQYTHFRWDTTLEEILFQIAHGKACVSSGVYDNLHHVTALVGYYSNQDITQLTDFHQVDTTQVQNIIMADPFGDYHTDYSSPNGRDITLPLTDFHNIVQVLNSPQKWAHLFTF